jgi:hypothetical protein
VKIKIKEENVGRKQKELEGMNEKQRNLMEGGNKGKKIRRKK